MEFINRNKDKLILTVIFALYCMIVFFVGIHHEPWADEAQSYLIARDCSIKEMFFDVLKYEGHPIVWYILLKLFIFISPVSCEQLYENIFILSSIFCIIGMYLFIFKSKVPIIYKLLLPFSYYLLYQYPVVARNHSLFFPMCVFLALFYKHRLNKPYIYSILLVVLANISAYSFVFSLVLFSFFGYDIYLKNKFNFKKYIPVVFVLILFLLTALYLKRPTDCTFPAKIHINIYCLVKLFCSFQESYFNNSNFLLGNIQAVFVCVFYYLNIKTFCKNNGQAIFFIALNLPLFILFAILFQNDWHCGYAIIYLIFTIWVLCEENNIKKIEFAKNKTFYIATFIILFIQIFWSIKTCLYDINHKYCSSNEVAQYIKDNNLEKLNIAALDFHTVAIQPYFKQNIYYNHKEAVYLWKKNAVKQISYGFKNKQPDIIITVKNYGKILQYKKNEYENKEFIAYMPSRGRLKESTSFNVYLRKRK